MLTVKQAAETARRSLLDLIGELDEIRLEEVEADGNEWLITLSYVKNAGFDERHYKIFRINKATGEVLSMKIRTLQT